MAKETDIFKLLESIDLYEKDSGKVLTTEEKVGIITKALSEDTKVSNKKRHRQ